MMVKLTVASDTGLCPASVTTAVMDEVPPSTATMVGLPTKEMAAGSADRISTSAALDTVSPFPATAVATTVAVPAPVPLRTVDTFPDESVYPTGGDSHPNVVEKSTRAPCTGAPV